MFDSRWGFAEFCLRELNLAIGKLVFFLVTWLLPLQGDLIIHPNADLTNCDIAHFAHGIDPKLNLRLLDMELLDLFHQSFPTQEAFIWR